MSEPRYRDWILETIDSLRSRKARPDLERICRMVRRRHGSDPDRTRAELEKLIQEQTVLKVNYKGSVSYRNAAKVQRKCRRKLEQAGERSKHAALNRDNTGACGPTDREARELTPCRDPSPSSRSAEEKREEEEEEDDDGEEEEEAAAVLCPAPIKPSSSTSSCDTSSPAVGLKETRTNPFERPTCTSARNNTQHAPQLEGARAADLGERLVAAVWSLTEGNRRGHAPLGLKEILGYLGTQAAHADGDKLTRHRVKVVLAREIEKGRLRRTRLGHISVPARTCGGSRLPDSRNCAPQNSRVEKQEDVKQDESTEVEGEPLEKEGESTPEPQNTEPEEDAVEVRVDTHTRLAAGAELSVCDGGVTHTAAVSGEGLRPSALPSSSTLSSAHQEAQRCGMEAETEMQGESIHTEGLTQDQSDQVNTHTQVEAVSVPDDVQTSPSSPDKTFNINTTTTNSVCKAEVGVSSCLLTPSASPGAAEDRGINGGVFVKSESSIVNPVDWTVADVASYFTAAGFPEQALAFRMQEIDGKSLLLMQRNDVLTGLSIRLGPALKIYERHVKVLQKTHFQEDEALC